MTAREDEQPVLVVSAPPGGAVMITPCCERLLSVPPAVVRAGRGTCPLCHADIERDAVKGRWVKSRARTGGRR